MLISFMRLFKSSLNIPSSGSRHLLSIGFQLSKQLSLNVVFVASTLMHSAKGKSLNITAFGVLFFGSVIPMRNAVTNQKSLHFVSPRMYVCWYY